MPRDFWEWAEAGLKDLVMFQYDGSVVLVRPLHADVREWLQDNCAPQVWFGGALVCEPRYADALLEGLAEDFIPEPPDEYGTTGAEPFDHYYDR